MIMKNTFKILGLRSRLVLAIALLAVFASCELRPELPESGSIADATPPSANFDYFPSGVDFRIVGLSNLSTEATNYLWDFGTDGVECEMVDGELVCGTSNTSTAESPFVKFESGEGTYTVSLTALDANNASNTIDIMVDIVDEFIALPVTVLNGDFEDGNTNWKIGNWDSWDGNAFESSSDGSWLLYDGTDNGSKTRGAKWNANRSVGSLANTNTRVAVQPIVVSPTTDERTVNYILEFEYAIKTDIATDPPEGRIVIADIVDGHYTDGDEAYAASDGGGGTSLLHYIASEAKGKGNFTTVTQEFTTNESGLVSIMFSAISPVDVYVDNVKVYPAN